MEPPQDFKSLQEGLQKSLVSSVKAVNRVAAEDVDFQRTVNPNVAEQLDDTSSRLLDLSSRLLKSAATACGLKPPTLEDVDDIDMNWRGIVDVVDTVLEKADTALDEYTGLIKRKEPPTGDSAPDPKKPKPAAKVVRNANITKPQVHFDVKPDNFPTEPWKPILTRKPHSTIPLEQSFVTFSNGNGSTQYKHPYDTEIFQMDYPQSVFEKSEPIPYQPVEKTKPTWVDTYEGVLEMLEDLKKAKEIAVDLEHHDFRTYTGLVCLMQISTREQDWIVDTLKPWRHKLEILNEVFADPNIIKVFHGAYMDMIWLQRDLGLYVNGLFDTYFACELLAYPGRSLAYLLSTFVGFTADKQYQLADWRMRPLPKEMMYYARSDTHYLLYIYDRVRNDLIAASDRSNPETDLIRRALEKSKDLSLYRHEHPGFDEKTGEGSRGWYGYILKHGHLSLDAEQFAVFRAIWRWRDAAARREDENPNFILGSNNIVQIARVNPPDMKALHSLLPLSAPIARSCLNELWGQIQATKSEGGPSLLHFLTSQAPESLKKNGVLKGVKPPTTLPVVDGEAGAERLARSQLFGNMPISSRWEESKKTANGQNDYIPFPWQRFVQESTEWNAADDIKTEGDAAEAETIAAAEAPAPNAEAMEEDDQEFTLKRGKKRKAAPADEDSTSSEELESDEDNDAASDEPMQDADNGVISIEEDQPKKPKNKKARKAERRAREQQIEIERAQKKAERKELKAQKKQQERKEKQEEKEKEKKDKTDKTDKEQKKFAAVPFDYSTAASVMNASRGGGEEQNKKKGKVFNPYAKSAEEGVKGARKAPPIRGEKSATFKK